jgi:hypothetical protein
MPRRRGVSAVVHVDPTPAKRNCVKLVFFFFRRPGLGRDYHHALSPGSEARETAPRSALSSRLLEPRPLAVGAQKYPGGKAKKTAKVRTPCWENPSAQKWSPPSGRIL